VAVLQLLVSVVPLPDLFQLQLLIFDQ